MCPIFHATTKLFNDPKCGCSADKKDPPHLSGCSSTPLDQINYKESVFNPDLDIVEELGKYLTKRNMIIQ